MTAHPSLDFTDNARFAVDADVRVTGPTADGRVLLHTRTARVWVLNGSGSQVWDRFAAGLPIDRVANELADQYDRSAEVIRQDLVALAGALVRAGLLRVEDGAQ